MAQSMGAEKQSSVPLFRVAGAIRRVVSAAAGEEAR